MAFEFWLMNLVFSVGYAEAVAIDSLSLNAKEIK
jgi:hypothetical protein